MEELSLEKKPEDELNTYCPNCGATVNSGQECCSACGYILTQENSEDTESTGNRRKRKKTILLCVGGAFLVVAILISVFYLFPVLILPELHLKKANSALADGNFASAIESFEKSGRIETTDKYYTAYQYACGMEHFSNCNYTEAATSFASAADYADAKTRLHDCGEQLLYLGEFSEALEVFSLEDDSEVQNEVNYCNGMLAYQDKNYSSAIVKLSAITTNRYKIPVCEVAFSRDSLTITEGETEMLVCTVTPDNANDKRIEWKSYNEAVASVNEDGRVTAVSEGVCTITATTSNGQSDECRIIVEKAGPDFKSIYSEYCDSTWATLGYDGSYLSIDTNPYDIDDYFDYDAYAAIYIINGLLGLPDSLLEDMGHTTALMGRQSETFDSLGITVSWSYHPDNGLQVTYKAINK